MTFLSKIQKIWSTSLQWWYLTYTFSIYPTIFLDFTFKTDSALLGFSIIQINGFSFAIWKILFDLDPSWTFFLDSIDVIVGCCFHMYHVKTGKTWYCKKNVQWTRGGGRTVPSGISGNRRLAKVPIATFSEAAALHLYAHLQMQSNDTLSTYKFNTANRLICGFQASSWGPLFCPWKRHQCAQGPETVRGQEAGDALSPGPGWSAGDYRAQRLHGNGHWGLTVAEEVFAWLFGSLDNEKWVAS